MCSLNSKTSLVAPNSKFSTVFIENVEWWSASSLTSYIALYYLLNDSLEKTSWVTCLAALRQTFFTHILVSIIQRPCTVCKTETEPWESCLEISGLSDAHLCCLSCAVWQPLPLSKPHRNIPCGVLSILQLCVIDVIGTLNTVLK